MLIGDYMDVRWEWLSDDTLRISIPRCFAREGMIRLGAIDRYECGIYERLFAWLDALDVQYDVEPEVTGCMAASGMPCSVRLQFRFAPRSLPRR